MSADGIREGRREHGTHQRARYSSPRWLGTNPRADASNPNPRRAMSARQWLQAAEQRERTTAYLAGEPDPFPDHTERYPELLP